MKTIALAHTKGGVGKSTVAFNLAVKLTLLGYKVKALDLDYNQILNFTNKLRLANKTELPKLDIKKIGTEQELKAEIAKQDADFTIIDLGGFDSALNRAAIACANMVVCPIKNSLNEALGFCGFATMLESIGSPKVHLLVNMATHSNSNIDDLKSDLSDYKNTIWLKNTLHRRAAFENAQKSGRGVVEAKPASYYAKATNEINALTNEVLEELNNA